MDHDSHRGGGFYRDRRVHGGDGDDRFERRRAGTPRWDTPCPMLGHRDRTIESGRKTLPIGCRSGTVGVPALRIGQPGSDRPPDS